MNKTFLTAALAALSLAASAATPDAGRPLWLRDVQISPDGKLAAFCYKGDIYVVSTQGGDARALTSQPSYECSPIWSPDGKTLAFASDRHGNFDVFTMPATGGSAQRLTFNSAAEVPQAFSADGEWVYFGAAIQDPAESVLFPTATLPELYQVKAAGGRTQQALATPAEMLSVAPDGSGFFYQDKKGYEDEWRKHHTSSITRDIWHYDAATGKHTNLTRHAGEDRNPALAPDGKTLFFLSERNGGSMNVYQMPCTGAAQPAAVTHFDTHPVRFLSVARDGTLCYTWDGEIYTQRQGGQPARLDIRIVRDESENMADLSFSSGAKEATVSADGKQVAFIVRGEVFVTATDYATTKQITHSAGAESCVDFAPDGRSLVYASERDGNWQLYIARIVRDEDPNFANATLIEEEVLLPSADVERAYPQFSPDGKRVAFIEDRTQLKVVDLASKTITQVTDGSTWYSQGGGFEYAWSPDGRWFVVSYIAHRRDPYTDIGIVSAEGGTIHPVTESGYMSGSARWAMDGQAILFHSERYGMRSHASWGSQDDAFLAFLTQDAYDRFRLSPEDYALLKEMEGKAAKTDGEADGKKEGKKGKKAGKPGKKKDGGTDEEAAKEKAWEPDFDAVADRIVRLTPNSSDMGDAILSKDGENLYYFAAFEGKMDLWKMDLRKRETKLISKMNTGYLQFEMDNDGNIFALGSEGLKKIDGKSDAVKPVAFSARMRLDLAAEREYMFRHMARQIEKKIFRTDYNGCDWAKMVENYSKFLPHIANNYDFSEMLSEILGELNVSHTGGRYFHSSYAPDVTASLGLLYNLSEPAAEGIGITEVLEGGPFDRKGLNVKPGDRITAINGEKLTAATDLAQLLNLTAGKKTLVSLVDAQGKASDVVVMPITAGRESDLLYRRWVKGRAAAVDSLSGGRLGYVHIEGMDDASFRNVYSDILGKYNEKEGIVIDTRYNGGGRLHEDIEILFSGEKYFTQVIRGREACDMPSRRYNRPSIMLQAEGNYSNAHGTPWVYQHRGIGKLVGAPVPGTMSSVNWERLQDSSLVFGVPVIGYQLPDGSYLENTQLEPDIHVLNLPETVVKGQDLQLEAAVKELLREIDAQ